LNWGNTVELQNENNSKQDTQTSYIQLSKQMTRTNILFLISISSLVSVLFLYFFFQNFLKLFYYTALLIVVFISLFLVLILRLKTIELTITTGKNIESLMAYKKGTYAIIIVIAVLLVLLFTNILISLLIIAFVLFFFLKELKIIYKESKFYNVFQKSPVVLILIFIALIAFGLSVQRISDFFPLLIEVSITYVFMMFFIESLSELKVPESRLHDETEIIREKVKEIFDEKTCEIHPSQLPSVSCLKCERLICELCKISYMNLCIYCYKEKMENRLLVFEFLTYLSAAIFTVFVISFFWGMFAPLPQILIFIEWLGLRYNRFTILFYYAAANFIILISLGGGGIFTSRQLRTKINQLEDRLAK